MSSACVNVCLSPQNETPSVTSVDGARILTKVILSLRPLEKASVNSGSLYTQTIHGVQN